MTNWFVKIRFPNGYSEELNLSGRSSVTIGQSGKCDICVPDSKLPQEHTLLKRSSEDRHWRLYPLDSNKAELIRDLSLRIGSFSVEIYLREKEAPLQAVQTKKWVKSLKHESKLYGLSFVAHLIILSLVAPSFPKPSTKDAKPKTLKLSKDESRRLFPDLFIREPIRKKKRKYKVPKEELTGKVLAKSGGQTGQQGSRGGGGKKSSGLLALDLSNLSPEEASSKAEDKLSFQVASSQDDELLRGFRMNEESIEDKDRGELLAISGEDGSGFRGLGGDGVALSPSAAPDLPVLPKSSEKKPKFITKITTKDGLEEGQVEVFVRTRLSEIEYCYELALVENEETRGRVETSWIIHETGKTSQVEILYSSILNTKLKDCIVKRISNWKFPKPKGGGIVKVRYPFNLTPKGAEK